MTRPKKESLTAQMRAVAGTLEPLTKSWTPGERVWDGAAYTPVKDARTPDPYAFAWWLTLGTVADVIDAQDGEHLSGRQLEYLRSILFSGMGSLQDAKFGAVGDRETVERVSADLHEKMSRLFELLQNLSS